MRSAPFIERPLLVQVLTGIVLVLFCVTFLRFVSLTFAQETPRQATLVTDAERLLFAERMTDRARHRPGWTRCGFDPVFTGLPEAGDDIFQTRLRLLRLRDQHRNAATVEQELKLRAGQRPEGDALLRARLGLDRAPVPIMR